MLPLQELLANLSLVKRDLVVPLDTQRFFYVDPESTKNFLDQVLDIEETDMKFFNVKQSKPYSNSLDKATIVNNSNATVMQQETFTKTTTGIFRLFFIFFIFIFLFNLFYFFVATYTIKIVTLLPTHEDLVRELQ